MDTAVVSTFVNSARPRKRFPSVGEMVRLDGRQGLLTVMRVDCEQRVADLAQRTARSHEVLEQNVPFHRIHNVPREISRAIQEFLQS